jgi:hypothetical protein
VTLKRRKWLYLTVGLAALVALLFFLTREREPYYQGKPLSYWVSQLGQVGSDRIHEEEGKEAVRQIGTNAIPHLLKWLVYEPPLSRPMAERVDSVIEHTPKWIRDRFPDLFKEWLDGEYAYLKPYSSVAAFAVLGTNAEAAIPDLEQLLKDRTKMNTSTVAMYSLAAISTNALPEIAARLVAASPILQISALEAVYFFPSVRTNAQPIVPLIVQCLNSPFIHVRRSAAYTLGFIEEADLSRTAIVVPSLADCFRTTSDDTARATAARALGKHGVQAASAVPVLLQAVHDPNKNVREAVTNALMSIAPWALTNAPAASHQ